MILLYHLVFPDSTPESAWNAGLILRLSAFKRQLKWLKQHGEILPLEAYVELYLDNPRCIKNKFALTFDDGYQQVYDLVVPFLTEEGIPATFFATTSHLKDGKLLWFVYINALCSEGSYQQIEVEGEWFDFRSRRSSMAAWQKLIEKARASGDAIGYSREISQKYPLPQHVIRKYIGISKDQLIQIGESDLLDVGGHTDQHPYLDQISLAEQMREMCLNKQILETNTGIDVRFFAYTGGIYNHDSIKSVGEVGFKAAFAVKPKSVGDERRWEIPRVEIYSPSMLKFRTKISSLYNLITEFVDYGLHNNY